MSQIGPAPTPNITATADNHHLSRQLNLRDLVLSQVLTVVGSSWVGLAAGLGSFAVASAITAVFVVAVGWVTQVRFSDALVAFAPGAMDAMLALALTLHIDPIFVGAHHISRFVFVSITTPGIIHLFGRPQDDVDD